MPRRLPRFSKAASSFEWANSTRHAKFSNLVAAYPQSPAGRAAGARWTRLRRFAFLTPKSRSVGWQRMLGGIKEGVESVLAWTGLRLRAGRMEVSASRVPPFDDNGTRGNAPFDQSTPGYPHAASAFERSQPAHEP
jgi:hypothetical protein